MEGGPTRRQVEEILEEGDKKLEGAMFLAKLYSAGASETQGKARRRYMA